MSQRADSDSISDDETKDCDIIVIGAGLMGAGVASALVHRGKRVIVLDAHDRNFTGGSSHGGSRITRTLSSEAQIFPRLAAESRAAMEALETTPGEIVRPMPAVFIMNEDSKAHRDVLKELQSRNRQAEQLDAREARETFGLRLRSDELALIDAEAAVFNPRLVLERLGAEIEKRGERIRFHCDVSGWSFDERGVRVTTSTGQVFRADQLVIAAGAWTSGILQMGAASHPLPALPPMNVYRIPLFFFEYPSGVEQAMIPVTLLDDGKVDIYAMPDGESAQKYLKVGFHQGEALVRDPDEISGVTEEERLIARNRVEERFGCPLELKHTDLCLYAQRAEDRPVVGRVPGTKNVFISSYGGGNCAKHAIALGAALSDLMCDPECAPSTLQEFDPAEAGSR